MPPCAVEFIERFAKDVQALPADFWDRHGKTMESWSQGGLTFYRISGPLVPSLLVNELVYLEAPGATPHFLPTAMLATAGPCICGPAPSVSTSV